MSQDTSLPIVVFLDSSTLRSINPRSELFAALLRLANEEVISIRLHEIIWKEVTTGLWEEAKQLIDKAQKIRKIFNWLPESETRLAYFNAVQLIAEIGTEGGADQIRKGFQNILQSSSIQVIRLSLEQTEEVFDSYFSGKAPFKNIKSREDIPDAFIFSTIKEASKNDDINVHVITSDIPFYNACVKLKNVSSHKSIPEFLRSDTIEERIRTLDREKSFDNWRVRFEKILSKNLVLFWDRLDYEVENWMRLNSNLSIKGVPLSIYRFGEAEKHELLSEKTSVISPLTAIVGVSMTTSVSLFTTENINPEVFLETFGKHDGVDYISTRSTNSRKITVGLPLELDIDVTIQLIPHPSDKIPFSFEVNRVIVKNLERD